MKDFKVIESKENSLIKLISGLQSSAKKRKDNSLFVLEGLRICKDAFENGIRFDKLIVSVSALLKYKAEISLFSDNADECIKIPDSLFNRISDTASPQGIIALAAIPDQNMQKIDKRGRYIALENVADPANLGAVARTAEALGVSGIILSSNGCDPYSPKALRASMGTLLRIPLIILENFASQIVTLDLKLYACVVEKNAEAIADIDFGDGCAIIIGNEANGISDCVRHISDKLITIPMKGSAESLNAAAAAAISIWEMMK